MPVAVVDVPVQAWNEVVLQVVLYGLDMTPDNHMPESNTIVEVTGTHEKLNQVLTRIRKKQDIELLDILESKLIDTGE